MRIQVLISALFVLTSLLVAQERGPGRKPVLIRADEEKKEEEIIVHDPAQAKRSVEIGDFYNKRDNYKAAEERYREAIRYNTQWAEPYEKLVRSLEQLGELELAIEACRLYLENNPESKKAEDFRKRIQKLEEESNSN